MPRTRKYRKGPRFQSLAELVMAIERGEFVYLNHKITHHGWARSMSLETLMRYQRSGGGESYGAFRALPNTEN